MEDESGVKVAATRLRRRLSVEAEDTKSPSAPATPTKKRSGRLAAKPQLELIDENATEAVPKKTRKSTVKDIIEPADEKQVTPSRRSTRIRSNTSILSETQSGETVDEKPITPARRSARIRSNTSLVSETTQNYDSPRAKRAARRTSQVGSDTETSTPARQTRRTRKDSASSVDKAEINSVKVATPIKEVIAEDVETHVTETNNNTTSDSDSHLLNKKSPRLMEKIPRKSSTPDNDNKENQPQSDKESIVVVNDKNNESVKEVEPVGISIAPSTVNDDSKPNEKVESKSSDQKNISISSAKLIEQMDTDNKNKRSKMNKTTSIVEESNEFKSKRHRTKSWTTISVPPPKDGSFYSDSEVSKKKTKRGSSNFDVGNNSGSGDGILNVNSQINKEKGDDQKNVSINTYIASEKKKNRHSKKSISNDELDQSVNIATKDKSINLEKIVTEIKIDPEEYDASMLKNAKLFLDAPTGVVQTLVYIEDSDSNTGSIGKSNTEKLFDGGDQCAPVIEHQLEQETSKQPSNVSCEPMDIDETIPENASIILLGEKDTSLKPEEQDQGGKRKSSICMLNEDSINKTNKSKRKSSTGNSESQNINNSDNENKSTLVLSQIKDISTNAETAETNLSKIIVGTNEPLSKSLNVNESDKNKNVDKKNLSLNYKTSTPLQQKSLKKIGMQINTSIITPNNKNKKDEVTNKSKNETAILSQNDDSDLENESDSEESSGENSKLVIDEAEEASDDYESGDSRDEEERQYEEDNEIKEKGETLNSDDEEEYSDDSDYEKGSFIVSSDEEDDKLLSGSEEDLDMSADELSMSAKSKKKYNERKIKEQKRASREMFQARHELDESDIKTKSNKSKKVYRLDSSDSENDMNEEKNNNSRQRIDSSQDISADVGKALTKKKKKTRRLSDSVCEDNATTEKEITICQESALDKNDPLSVQNFIKEEPKTPLKGLDISTVEVTNMAEVEEIHVDENASMLKINETSDPLQATALQDDSMSENEEITQNYDSLLNNLNSSKSKKIKTLDMSLNINKKEKQKTKEPVIDQLNLTQTKKSKKNKKTKPADFPEPKQINVSIDRSTNKKDGHNEDSSDSIDMKLLFPEDSNDSEVLSPDKQNKVTKEVADKEDYTNEIVEDFIPLKRTEAKTNILEGVDSTQPDKSELNSSKTKNKKSKLSEPEFSTSKDDQDDNEVSFFIDTTGTGNIEEVEYNTLNKNSAKKTKHKRDSESVANIDEINNTATNSDIIQLNVSMQNSSKKKKRKKNDASAINTSEIKDETVANEAINKGRDNSAMANTEEIKGDITDSVEIESEVPVKNSAKKNKSKKKDASIIDADETQDIDITAEEPSLHSAKKKKNKNISLVNSKEVEDDVIDLDTSTKSKGKKNKYNESLDTIEVNISIKNSGKKNKKNSLSLTSAEEIKQDMNFDEVDANVSITNAKKNKRNSMSFNNEESIVDAVNDRSASESGKKKKKNKKLLDTSKTTIEAQQEVDEIDGAEHIDNPLITDGSHKKKKKRISESQIAENTEETHVIINEDDKSHKRKRKLSANQSIENTVKDDTNTSKSFNEIIITGSQKKKRKVSHNNEEVVQNKDPINEIHQDVAIKKSKRKNKHKQNLHTDQSNENILPSMKNDVTNNLLNAEEQSQSETKKDNKKRKRSDVDDEGKYSKIIKLNSSDKVHIPRLPDDLLKQLDDKPKQVVEMKKANIISTTPFLVEPAKKRKNKPSNYLEESVYLNDTIEENKQKGTIKTPKVLPFIPTASTSDSGFTTNFRINVIKEQPVFSQSNDVDNFKNQYLHNKKIKKLGTFEKYKRQRNIKLSKF